MLNIMSFTDGISGRDRAGLFCCAGTSVASVHDKVLIDSTLSSFEVNGRNGK